MSVFDVEKVGYEPLRSDDRLALLRDARDGMTVREMDLMADFLLGYICRDVPAERWAEAVAAAKSHIEAIR